MDKFIHSVRLDEDACQGCINCIKYCPTQAIRVQNGKARIKSEYCVDCGRCIRYCPHHAKIATYDSVDDLKNYEYKVALPAPSLYSQFNNLTHVDTVLNALLAIGFDDVFEVSAAAELVTQATRDYMEEHPMTDRPYISTACPTIVRLIRVKYPALLPCLLPIKPPIEIAAEIARKKAIQDSGLPSDKIGLFFISPCPSKVTYVKSPLGVEKSQVDKALAIKDIYPLLLEHMTDDVSKLIPLSTAGRIGIGWGSSGGEAAGLETDNYLACDDMMSSLRVLEELEDKKYNDLKFVELNACNGGCVGGTLNVENPYIANAKSKKLLRYVVENPYFSTAKTKKPLHYLPVSETCTIDIHDIQFEWEKKVEYEPVFQLGGSLKERLEMLNMIEDLVDDLPGLDCGSCGAPTCRALAEDIVRGDTAKTDCIYYFEDYIRNLTGEISKLTQSLHLEGNDKNTVTALEKDIDMLFEEVERRERNDGNSTNTD